MLLAMMLVATSFPVGSLITNELPPAILMLLRYLIAVMLFLPLVIFKYQIKRPSLDSIARYFLISAPLVVFFWCMFESLRYTSVLNTGALYTLVPAITAVYALLINKESTGRTRSIGLLFGTFGALWIIFRGDIHAAIALDLNYGDLIFLTGCLFMGSYNPLLKKYHRGEPMIVITFWLLVTGSVMLFLISLPDLTTLNWLEINDSAWWGIAYLAFFTTWVTFLIINLSTMHIGPTRVSSYTLLTPLLVIILSLILGMDRFETNIIPGIILITGSMLFIQREQVKAA